MQKTFEHINIYLRVVKEDMNLGNHLKFVLAKDDSLNI